MKEEMVSRTVRLGLAASVLSFACGDDGASAEGSASTGGSGDTTSLPTSTTQASTPTTTATTQGSTASAGGSTSGTESGDAESSEGSTTGDPVQEPPLQGYGTDSTFGEGGETCVVDTVAASGPGSLFDCVLNRDTNDDNPTPRLITFEVGGTIQLEQELAIRQPFLTIDGITAPEPGITIEQTGDGSNNGVAIGTWPPQSTCAHDVLIQGLRIQGVWTPDQGAPGVNLPSLVMDAENIPGCIHNVVLDRVTVLGALDSAGDIWGGATDITFQYSAFLNSYHPSSWSHFPGGEPDQQRERLSMHHNLWANNHERNPQIRASVRDLNFEQNIVHNWDPYGLAGGYGVRIRCRNGACPERFNFIGNHFTSMSPTLDQALVLGEVVGADADEAQIAAAIYMEDNRLPPENVDSPTATEAFPRPPIADVDLFEPTEVVERVLPFIGAPYRTSEEDAIFEDVAEHIAAEQ